MALQIGISMYRSTPAPAKIDQKTAQRRLGDIVTVLSAVFAVDRKQIVVKQRQRQRGKNQYEKMQQDAPDWIVLEGQHQFIVNLQRYLDTGLFLDHRPVRRHLATAVKGKRFLNLFSYTSAATVYAAKAGARSSTSVDMSKTYMHWSQRNFRLNKLPVWQHQTVQADCLQWLKDGHNDSQFDCILLDPPSFSNSQRMQTTLDIQRDHVELIDLCMRRLAPGGCLYFSNNRRGFKLSEQVGLQYQIEDISRQTQDPDFDRPRLAHRCWLIRH